MSEANVLVDVSLHSPFPTFPPFRESHLEQIRKVHPGARVASPSDDAEFWRELPGTEVLFTWFPSSDIMQQARHLRWVQVPSAGLNHALNAELLESPVLLTNSAGIHGVPIAENILGMMLVLARKLHDCMRLQMEGRWGRDDVLRAQPPLSELYGCTVGIVGLGSIGIEVAKRAKVFGMQVLGTKRNVSVDTGVREGWVDRLVPPQNLPELLRESDYVVIALPLTSETQGLIGEAELRAMKRTAFILNVGRGPIIQEAVLVQALEKGWIAGAGLDVTEREPLPAESALYRLPNVLVTPHYSGISSKYWERATDLFCANLERYLRGQELLNVVKKESGY